MKFKKSVLVASLSAVLAGVLGVTIGSAVAQTAGGGAGCPWCPSGSYGTGREQIRRPYDRCVVLWRL
jgi:hypothetical protein